MTKATHLVGTFCLVQTALLSLLSSCNNQVASAFGARQLAGSKATCNQRDRSSFVARHKPRNCCIATILLATNDNEPDDDVEATTSHTRTTTIDLESMDTLQDLVVASSLSYLSLDNTVIDNIDIDIDIDTTIDGSKSSTNTKKTSKMEASPYFTKSPLQPLCQVVDPKTESGATIFSYQDNNDNDDDDDNDDDGDDTLVVACRGSATPINFATNLRFRLVPHNDFVVEQEAKNYYLVHEGFQEASEGLWKILGPKLDNMMHHYSNIVFTGHSLGAANALLCAAKYQFMMQDANHSAGANDDQTLKGIVTFGGPRLVNTALADFWNRNHGLQNTLVQNYVHTKDPILRQNGPLWDSMGFGIVGTEVLCEPFRPIAYSENEKEERLSSKQDLPLAWNILDHCNYLGVFVGPRII